MTTPSHTFTFPQPGDLSTEQLTQLAQLINVVYQVGEGELFQPGLERTHISELESLISKGELLCLFVEDNLQGCARLAPYDDQTFKFGMLSVDTSLQGQGYGKHLLTFMENHARNKGAQIMRLELLEPTNHVHAHKKFLRDWYERLGYRPIGQSPFPLTHLLATECTFTHFAKVL